MLEQKARSPATTHDYDDDDDDDDVHNDVPIVFRGRQDSFDVVQALLNSCVRHGRRWRCLHNCVTNALHCGGGSNGDQLALDAAHLRLQQLLHRRRHLAQQPWVERVRDRVQNGTKSFTPLPTRTQHSTTQRPCLEWNDNNDGGGGGGGDDDDNDDKGPTSRVESP